MNQPSTAPAPETGSMRPFWASVAWAAAIVAGLFSIVLSVLLTVNHLRSQTTGLVQADALRGLRKELRARPGDEDLKKRIRAMDLELRADFFRRKYAAEQGAALLLGGLIVFLASVRMAEALSRKPLAPPGGVPDPRQVEDAIRKSRWAVGGTAAIVGCAALAFALGPQARLSSQASGAFQAAAAPDPATRPAIEQPPRPAPGGEKPVPAPDGKSPTGPSDEDVRKNWPQFRGPGGLGVSAFTNVPSTWNGKTGEGILWKTEVPLPGENSPVVWGNRIFLTGATKEKREVYCFDTDSGKLLWQKPVTTAESDRELPREVMADTGYAAPTAATDGQRVFAIFANGDIAGFRFDGEMAWARNLGVPENQYGHASSLAVWRNQAIVQFDQGFSAEGGKSKLLALDSATGKTVWETARAVPNSWASPILIRLGKEDQIITCANPWVIAYDPFLGSELWRADCLSGDVAPSPTFGNGMVYVANAYAKVAAIPADRAGDATADIVWTAQDGLPDTCSLLCDGPRLYLLGEGWLTCYDAKKGNKIWERETRALFKASPSLVGDQIYLLNEDGVVSILKCGDEYKELGRAELGEPCSASPAFLDGRIYIRSKKHLYGLGRK